MEININEGITTRVIHQKDLHDWKLVQRFACPSYVYEACRGEGGVWLFRAAYEIQGRESSGPQDRRKGLQVLPYGNGCWFADQGPWCETFYTK